MKKLGILLSFILFLSGCMSSSAVRIVEDMYRKVLLEEDAVEAYFSEDFKEENTPFEAFKEKLYLDVIEREGVSLMHLKELTSKQINPLLVDKLNQTFGDNWHVVVAQVDDENVMVWVVERGENQYIIVDGKEVHVEEYHRNILNGEKQYN